MKLWHFTCDHGHAGLGQRGVLVPIPHPLLPELGPMIWMTDDPAPKRDDVGLTSYSLSCDRMAYRYRVTVTTECVTWESVAGEVSRAARYDLESCGAPWSWWLSFTPVAAVLA